MAKKKKKLTRHEAIMTRHAAIRLLASMHEDDEVIAAISNEFGIQHSLAKRVVADAWNEICTADDGLDVAKKKGFIFMATREHHRRCLEKGDLAQGTATLRLMARLWNLDQHPKDAHQDLGALAPKDEFTDRSAADLKYYADHGHWPEDKRPPKKDQAVPKDPLAGLH